MYKDEAYEHEYEYEERVTARRRRPEPQAQVPIQGSSEMPFCCDGCGRCTFYATAAQVQECLRQVIYNDKCCHGTNYRVTARRKE